MASVISRYFIREKRSNLKMPTWRRRTLWAKPRALAVTVSRHTILLRWERNWFATHNNLQFNTGLVGCIAPSCTQLAIELRWSDSKKWFWKNHKSALTCGIAALTGVSARERRGKKYIHLSTCPQLNLEPVRLPLKSRTKILCLKRNCLPKTNVRAH